MKAIAFYLPQFHPIPENDRWWGPGFTEWTNVAKGRPLFEGHYQPHIPADLGFYDLRLGETRIAQAKMAAQYGVEGFCYYHYWFNGQLLLEKPAEAMVAEGQPDFPFCYCWANETWSRRWDGQEHEILITQDFARYDPSAHFEYLSSSFRDRRYIRISGKPLFLVYRIDQFPDICSTVKAWREAAAALGLPGIYLCAVRSHMHSLSDIETIALGFDAIVGFEPHSRVLLRQKTWACIRYLLPRSFNYLLRRLGLGRYFHERPVLHVFDYSKFVRKVMRAGKSAVRFFPCVIPSWDNSARRRSGATVIQNDDPVLFEAWLRNCAERVKDNPKDEQLVFINAWNEWAEGCHLEPDLRHGNRFLEAVARVFGTPHASQDLQDYADRREHHG
ncbi:Glycosyl hydrolase [Candidatus Nitrotoga sp. HW29]|uniref:glycosyltransferase WbsX family protein n=1 Tax=Candidatus Nitrotoga sp. HW29 TaxID=2886963 RepID=UPI001EF212F2|nr:glycoside hydrolase family 99-like domain-containing protein [Candidatus Nitrotoga sp. HW29]CAH1906344.1 Glycosyl hydrolase [Candidatus Nitrotoga sp. HW29]